MLFIHSVVSDCLQPHRLQLTRFSCPSPSPGAWTNSCTFSRWCHLTISFSVFPLSSCLQSFPASEYFPMSHLFASGGQSIGPSALAGYSNGGSWLISFKIDWFGFLAVKGTLKTLLQHHSLKASILQCSAIFVVQISHLHMTAGKKQHSFAYMDHCRQSNISAF